MGANDNLQWKCLHWNWPPPYLVNFWNFICFCGWRLSLKKDIKKVRRAENMVDRVCEEEHTQRGKAMIMRQKSSSVSRWNLWQNSYRFVLDGCDFNDWAAPPTPRVGRLHLEIFVVGHQVRYSWCRYFWCRYYRWRYSWWRYSWWVTRWDILGGYILGENRYTIFGMAHIIKFWWSPLF